jgi:hypothetical protein
MMKAKIAKTEANFAASARGAVLISMGRVFRCSPLKAAERMTRPGEKYDAYRVAFVNGIDFLITQIFAHVDNGHCTLVPTHWSSLIGVTEKERFIASLKDDAEPIGGRIVTYWFPKEAA